MKWHLWLSVAVTMALLLICRPAMARVEPLTDEAMAAVTGQAGISFTADQVAFDMRAKNIYYGDMDGIGPGTGPGYISLTNVSLKGSVAFSTPMTVDVAMSADTIGNVQVKNLLFKLRDMTLKIDSFYIDAIRLGSAPGKGNSLGSIGIENLTLRMTGNFTISVD